jgi:ABC-type arginine transport system permease subunit
MSSYRKAIALAFTAGLITATAAFAAYQQAASPHLNAALKSLQDAQGHLTASKATGMHTQAAMTATKSAIEHTKEAIAAGEEK